MGDCEAVDGSLGFVEAVAEGWHFGLGGGGCWSWECSWGEKGDQRGRRSAGSRDSERCVKTVKAGLWSRERVV